MCGYAKFCLSTYQLEGIWLISILWLLWIMPLWAFIHKFLCEEFYISLGMKLLGHVILMLDILRNYCSVFQRDRIITHFHPQWMKVQISPPSGQHFCFLFLFFYSHSIECEVVWWWFWFAFPQRLRLSIFTWAYWPFTDLLWGNVYSSPMLIFFNCIICLLVVVCQWCLLHLLLFYFYYCLEILCYVKSSIYSNIH